MQYLGNTLLEGGEVNEGLIEVAYQLFKEDSELEPEASGRDAIVFNKKVAEDADADQPLSIQCIKDIKNVNALAAGQAIHIGPRLTVIYGKNGTGKSGYVRMLNKAFLSRGDKDILKNVFDSGAVGDPECTFTFKRTEEPYDLSYPIDKDSYEFAQFAVFDTKSVKEHLGNENQLSFTPSGFGFFDKLLIAQTGIRERLAAEISTKSAMHDLGPMFVNGNEVCTFVEGLDATTDLSAVETLCTLTTEDASRWDEIKTRLETLKAADKTKQVDELAAQHKQLSEFCEKAKEAFAMFDAEAILNYKKAIEAEVKLEGLTRAEGIQNLEKYQIEGIDSPEWSQFVVAGRTYADVIEKARNGTKYPAEGDNCLLCLQPLGAEQKELLHACWNLLKSSAQSELNVAKIAVGQIKAQLSSLPDLVFDETNTSYEIIEKVDANLADKWKHLTTKYTESVKETIVAIAERDATKLPKAIEATIADFDDCLKKLNADKAALIESNFDELKAEVQREIALFEDRSLLNKVKAKVEAYIAGLNWAARARLKDSSLAPGKITKISGTLYEKHITEEYLAVFREECDHLDAPEFVKITQRNSKGNTLRRLKIEGEHAVKILSEGEQRAIAISDFITEARMNPHNRGLIFDDPVSSQDHDRRERIAERLIELAKGRQVIVFTHEIPFLQRMTALAKKQQVEMEITTVRNTLGRPGVVKPELPFPVQPVAKRIGWLRDRLVKLVKLEEAGEEDEYFEQAKLWYTFLREGWERAVEESLFNDVVQRYDPRVQTQRLREVRVTDELLTAVEQSMTASSNWVHDQPQALNAKPPTSKEAERDLGFLDAFVQRCKAAK